MQAISTLLPHRPPWALVDRILSASEDTVVGEKRISAADPLLHGRLAGPLVMEALAQTAACLMGLRNGHRAGHRGYLVAARGWKFPDSAESGETVTLIATQRSELGGLHAFDAVARVGEREIASGTMTFAVHFE